MYSFFVQVWKSPVPQTCSLDWRRTLTLCPSGKKNPNGFRGYALKRKREWKKWTPQKSDVRLWFDNETVELYTATHPVIHTRTRLHKHARTTLVCARTLVHTCPFLQNLYAKHGMCRLKYTRKTLKYKYHSYCHSILVVYTVLLRKTETDVTTRWSWWPELKCNI